MLKKNPVFYVSLTIVLLNILNQFLLITACDGVYFQEGTTFFNYAFLMKNELTAFFVNNQITVTYTLFFAIIIFLFDFTLLLLIFKKKTHIILITSILAFGCLLHLFMNVVCTNVTLSGLSYGDMFCRGMFGNMIWVLSYIALYFVLVNHEKINKWSKTEVMNKICHIVSIELLFAFFYFSIVNSLSVFIDENAPSFYHGVDYWLEFNRLFYSPFMMTLSYDNALGLPGNVEFYPYMWLMLIASIAVFIACFFKKKEAVMTILGGSLISIIVLIIGAIDMLDSFMMNYVSSGDINFGTVLHPSFYFIILLNLLIIGFKTPQLINLVKKEKEAYYTKMMAFNDDNTWVKGSINTLS